MSRPLEARVYVGRPCEAREVLKAMMHATTVAGIEVDDHEWSLRVYEDTTMQLVRDIRVASTNNAFEEAIRTVRANKELLFVASNSMACWRFPRGTAERGRIQVSIFAWTGTQNERCDGNARLVVREAGDYWALIDSPGDHFQDVCNRHIEENLEAFFDIVRRYADVLSPQSIKVFTDYGSRIPVNSHLTYFADSTAVLQDIGLLREFWDTGIPYLGVGKGRELVHNDDPFALSELRTLERRNLILAKLGTALLQAERTSQQDVEAVLKAHRKSFDLYWPAAGFFVLNFPHYLNSYVEEFYFQILGVGE